MGYAIINGEDYEWDDPATPEVIVTDNPVTATLLDATGRIIRQWTERPPIGFR